MTNTDVHQHVWTEPLLRALEHRHEFPFIRREYDLTVLFLSGERPYVIDVAAESAERRRHALRLDGIERALVCISSPLGIEALTRAEAAPLIDAYHEGALGLGEGFGVWGAIPVERPAVADVEDVLARGCVGVSLPAGALAQISALTELHAVLDRMQQLGAPLLVHPGPGRPAPGLAHSCAGATALDEPLWWPALTRYVAEMQAAWLAFATAGRQAHPRLRVIFTMLAGLAPLHAERLRARGGGEPDLADPLTFYETSSYGPDATAAIASLVGPRQILFGSDRPLVDAADVRLPDELERGRLAQNTARALYPRPPQTGRSLRRPRPRVAEPAHREISPL
jgi:hypothetical protein